MEVRNAYKILLGKPEGRDHLEYLGVEMGELYQNGS
jgi:hypothetical protein